MEAANDKATKNITENVPTNNNENKSTPQSPAKISQSEKDVPNDLNNAQETTPTAVKITQQQPSSTNAKPESIPPQQETRKSKREDRLKKDDKSTEQLMKSLNSVPTLEEKLSLVCKKYVQAMEDNKKLQFYIKQSDKRYTLLLKEKEQLQLESNKHILVKSKLENLCRELQKQNKAIKEESTLKIREEEERLRETQAKFQSTLSEITTLLHQNNEKNAKLRDDNISMSDKFKSVVAQYQLREQQVDKMAKQMALESQLWEAKLQKASLEQQAERERLLAEMEQLKITCTHYRAKLAETQGTENDLRGQLAVYTDKYDEFQSALIKSNQVFGGFKEQMEKMSKKIKKLEKESLSWKKRWETSQTALLDMCGERQAGEERSQQQLARMQGLCRALQAERTALLNTLKENNIERPPVPVLPPPPPTPVVPAQATIDAKAATCATLKQSLAHLQNQLNVLTTKQASPEVQPKPEKTKKSKSKKSKAEKTQKVQDTPKDAESDEGTKQSDVKKDVAVVNDQPNADGDKVENEDSSEPKVDEKTLESLIEAISHANINLADLDGVDVEKELNGVSNDNAEVATEESSKQVDVEIKPKEISKTAQEDVLNNSAVEIQSNDEIAHVAEIKSISNEA